MPFDDLLGPGYLELMKHRLHGETTEELVWPRQMRDLLIPYLKEGIVLLEAGCCLGVAYRAFEAVGVKYIGLDYEPKYLAIAREWYQADPNVSFIEHNFIKGPLPQIADIVICSAALEHCPGFQPALKNLASGAQKALVLRTFFGNQEEIAYSVRPNGERFYINQYAFQDILGYLAGIGFTVSVHRDRHTDSIPQFQSNTIRTFYVVLAEKK